MKQLLGAPLYSKLSALLLNPRLDWKGLPGTSTLAYREHSQIKVVKSFITLVPGVNVIKLFSSLLTLRQSKLECFHLASLYWVSLKA